MNFFKTAENLRDNAADLFDNIGEEHVVKLALWNMPVLVAATCAAADAQRYPHLTPLGRALIESPAIYLAEAAALITVIFVGGFGAAIFSPFLKTEEIRKNTAAAAFLALAATFPVSAAIEYNTHIVRNGMASTGKFVVESSRPLLITEEPQTKVRP